MAFLGITTLGNLDFIFYLLNKKPINLIQSFFLLFPESFKERNIDTVRPLDGKSEGSCPNIVGQAPESSGNTENDSIEVILSHT